MASVGELVIAGILPKNVDRLEVAASRLSADHFTSADLKVLWGLVEFFHQTYRTIPTADTLRDRMTRVGIDKSKILSFLSKFQLLSDTQVSDADFSYALDSLSESYITRRTGEAIATGFEILEDGREIEGTLLKGSDSAREWIQSQFAEIGFASDDALSEGDVRAESNELWAEYETAKEADADGGMGIKFGISCLDDQTNGVFPGELTLVAAFTSAGKSHLLAQTAWNAVVSGKNVFLVTSETVREQMRRRILARHSRHLGVMDGAMPGLNTKTIKEGRLSADLEESYREVIHDFATNPSYGHLRISQMPRRGTLGFVEHRVALFNRDHPVDLVAIDSLQLMHPESGKKDEREAMNEILKDAKVWASSFDGRGVPIVSPWQMSREAMKIATDNGGSYSMASLADTSEAEKSSSLIVSMYKVPELANTVNLQILKNRDGPAMDAAPVHYDYRNSFIGDDTATGPSTQDHSGTASLESLQQSVWS